MIPLGLDTTGLRSLVGTLTSHHSVRINVGLLDLDHRGLDDFSARLIDGQVDLDRTGDVVDRASRIVIADPEQRILASPSAPAGTTVHVNRMLRIKYQVKAPRSTVWSEIPIFTGPITGLDRQGDNLSIEAQGKELLARHALASSKSWPKGTPRHVVIGDLLALSGEIPARMDLDYCGSIMSPVVFAGVGGGVTDVWALAKRVAAQVGFALMYDGRGVVRLFKPSGRAVFTFKTGTGGSILTDPDLTLTKADTVNAVRVVGQPAKDKDPIPVALAYAQSDSPVSPWKLGRGGKPLAWLEDINSSDTKTLKAAKTLAADTITARLAGFDSLNAVFDSLPIPMLELYDRINVATDDWVISGPLSQMTIPLSVQSNARVGATAWLSRTAPRR